MLNAFGGHGSGFDLNKYKGLIIQEIAIRDGSPDELRITFTDGRTIILQDDRQSCCEVRYMHTDDDLQYVVGATLLSVEVADGPTKYYDYEVRESQFLRVHTSKGTVTIVNYNSHNGYYGGFCMTGWEIRA